MTQPQTGYASKARRAIGLIPQLGKAFTLIWSAARGWTLAWGVLLILQGLLPVAVVYLTRQLVDQLALAIRSGGDRSAFSPLLLPAILMASVILIQELARRALATIRTAQSEQVMDAINALIHQKSTAVDLAFYDSPDYYDQLHLARADATYRPLALLESMGNLLQNGITLAAMMAVLIPYSAWLPVALVLSTLPVLWVVLRNRVRLHQWRLRVAPDERRVLYYDWLLTGRETAAELRLFNLGKHFQDLYQTTRSKLRRERLELSRSQGISEGAASLLALVITAGAMAWIVWQALQARVTLGDIALFYAAFNQGQSLMRSSLENAGEIYSNSLFLGDLFNFLALEPQIKDVPPSLPVPEQLQHGIRFEKVTFRYPGAQQAILDQFDLDLPAGQMVAIVGVNGAGKSTLVKLLCRLYDPESGRVTLDGTDLRQFPVAEYHQHLTVLFQEPVQYFATARENIMVGDSGQPAAISQNSVEEAARLAGAEQLIQRLPHGYDTLLGKWFEGGSDLSVGEWQRIALARAFLRQAQHKIPLLILLDEPTSAMDPWAEIDWLNRFRQMGEGRTTVLITHRFTTAAYADRIYVMDQGRIVEAGSHAELLASQGRYAQSWLAQMQRWMTPAQANTTPSDPGEAAEA